ncbi:MAG: pyrroline-5-carboxylate reductase [Tepidisphaerales bacterium]
MFPLGFLGAGNMAEAIVRALLTRGVARPGDLIVSDPAKSRRDLFTTLGIAAVADNREVARRVSTLVLSCKPQQMKDVLSDIAADLPATTLLVSIAAGVDTASIRRQLGRPQHPVVRVMPNTPLLVGEGMAAIAPADGVPQEAVEQVLQLFEVAGRVVEVTENLMDAVTAVSGSGPAYYFLLTEHLARAAVELGLDEETAQVLARQTALGSAVMMARSVEPLDVLRQRVTSPGGTTQAAVESMERAGVPEAFRRAVHAAAERGRQLRGT